MIHRLYEGISCSNFEDVNEELKGVLSYVFVLLVRPKNNLPVRTHDLNVFANHADRMVCGFFVIRSIAIHINMDIVFTLSAKIQILFIF